MKLEMKIRFPKVIGLIILMGISHSQYAQKIRCATMEQDSINRLKFPQRGELNDFELSIQNKIAEINVRASGRTQATIITIPIIVHVVHNGEPVGSGTNISKEQVAAQLEVLNEDFRKKIGTPGYNSSGVGADIEIEFCLSPVNENGTTLAEPGIHRVRGSQSTWSRAEIDGSLKPSTIWNPNLFFNVWTLKFGGADANLLGYAQFPDQSNLDGLNSVGGPATTDGVVVQYSSFGSADKGTFPVMQAPYNKGRTLTHETGHWLGLRHIWGDGACGNDFVSDTPIQQNESRGCPTNKLSCDGSTPAMVQNYMDYSDDACMNIFTNGQKARIRAVIELSPRRKTLGEGAICNGQANEVPVAKLIKDDKKCILLGSSLTFTDLSTNFPTSWQWTFEGGDPSSSTAQNPKVKYNSPGKFYITLIASNSIGPSLLVKDSIVVTSEGLCATPSNFKNEFTPSVLKLSAFGNYSGYLTGHNSLKSQAFSEFFSNDCGYQYISGVNLKFGKLVTDNPETTVNIVVWNARGTQNSPAAVIERKEILLKQIKEDIANNRMTSITFDRETPVFGKPFQVGFEISYANSKDTLAIVSSANGEATNATSWIKNSSGTWAPYTIALGANIAMNIQPSVGVNPSVQVSASKTLIYPGEEVTLNASGASIFVWTAADNSIQSIGPQLTVRPSKTTTYITTGSGLELCNGVANTTIYTREGTVTEVDKEVNDELRLYPVPGNTNLTISFANTLTGEVNVVVQTVMGQSMHTSQFMKYENRFTQNIDTSLLPTGLYLVNVSSGGHTVTKKWIKINSN
jgi:PKD repeat protein